MSQSKEKKQKSAEIIVPNDSSMEKALGRDIVGAPGLYISHEVREEKRICITVPYNDIKSITDAIAEIEKHAGDHEYNIRVEWC